MKRFYVSVVTFLFVSMISFGSGLIFPNAWAIGFNKKPVETETAPEPEPEPAPTQVQAFGSQTQTATTTVDTSNLQIIDRGQLLYDGQFYDASQVGNTLYLPAVQRAYDVPTGYEPIFLWGNTILFNPTTGRTINVNWNEGYDAMMPKPVPTMPDPIPTMPDPIPTMPDPIPTMPDPIPTMPLQ